MNTGLIIAWAICVASICLLIRHQPLSLARATKTSHSTVHAIRDLLAPPKFSLSDMLVSRAIPNARLVHVFRLTNTFVSADIETHNSFRKRAVSFLHDMYRNGGWPCWAQVASQAVYIQLPSSSTDVPFDKFIQAVTFRTVTSGLLNPAFDQTSFNQDNIDFITSTITTLWDHSKRHKIPPTSLLEQLNTQLRVYFADEDAFPNPLDFIIPSWETLWRIVAAAVANMQKNDQSRAPFLRFNNDPNVETFRMWVDGEPSVEAIITETLRLHPPTKRIARSLPKCQAITGQCSVSQHFASFWSANGWTREVADIEAVQRSRVWLDIKPGAGVHTYADTTSFDPTRHRARTDAQGQTLMAFGYGRLGCVAKEWAPMAAGLIVGAILGGLDEEFFEIITGPKIGGRIGWDGWCVRRKNTNAM